MLSRVGTARSSRCRSTVRRLAAPAAGSHMTLYAGIPGSMAMKLCRVQRATPLAQRRSVYHTSLTSPRQTGHVCCRLNIAGMATAETESTN